MWFGHHLNLGEFAFRCLTFRSGWAFVQIHQDARAFVNSSATLLPNFFARVTKRLMFVQLQTLDGILSSLAIPTLEVFARATA